MATVLITGMSGTGKSTVLTELGRRGHRIADIDDLGWAVEVSLPDGSGLQQLWREEPVTALLAEHSNGSLFVAGCASNQRKFANRFDVVVLLSAPRDVLLDRVQTRTTNPFGQAAAERQRILDDLERVEPLLRTSATAEIVTNRPVPDVADEIEALARGPVAPLEGGPEAR